MFEIGFHPQTLIYTNKWKSIFQVCFFILTLSLFDIVDRIMSDFIRKQKKKYKRLKSCYCPALGETVYFTSDGMNHLLYKNRRPRSVNERYYRLGLIRYIILTIKKSKSINCRKKRGLVTYSIEYNFNSFTIKIIILKEKNRYIFLSIMKKK